MHVKKPGDDDELIDVILLRRTHVWRVCMFGPISCKKKLPKYDFRYTIPNH